LSFAHFTHPHMSDDEAARLDALPTHLQGNAADSFERKKADDTEGGDLD